MFEFVVDPIDRRTLRHAKRRPESGVVLPPEHPPCAEEGGGYGIAECGDSESGLRAQPAARAQRLVSCTRLPSWGVSGDAAPINPRAWADYVEGGRAHFDRVVRSYSVFIRNAGELVDHIGHAEGDPRIGAELFTAPPSDTVAANTVVSEFWGVFDQRLHNVVASAVSLVDHTRPLVQFYEHEKSFTAEWSARNAQVAATPRAGFLRRLRNYLLHYGMAPTAMSISFGTKADEVGHEGLRIELSPTELLRFDGWTRAECEFIEGFSGGVPILQIVVDYATEMQDLYRWLFEQHKVLHVPGVPPWHLYTPTDTAPKPRI